MNRIVDYLSGPERRGMITMIALALLIGLGAGFFLSRPRGPQSNKPDAPIEWNKVQAIPKPRSDVEDNEWQERAAALDDPRPRATNRAEDSENAVD
jgi:hypothetical protein